MYAWWVMHQILEFTELCKHKYRFPNPNSVQYLRQCRLPFTGSECCKCATRHVSDKSKADGAGTKMCTGLPVLDPVLVLAGTGTFTLGNAGEWERVAGGPCRGREGCFWAGRRQNRGESGLGGVELVAETHAIF